MEAKEDVRDGDVAVAVGYQLEQMTVPRQMSGVRPLGDLQGDLISLTR